MFRILVLSLITLLPIRATAQQPILVYSEPQATDEAPPVVPDPEAIPEPTPMPAQLKAEYHIEIGQKAESASVSADPDGSGVLIRSINLEPEQFYLAIIATDERAQWATQTRLDKQELARNLPATQPGEFIIRGPPEGARYQVFIWPVELGQPPAILPVAIPGLIPPEPEPEPQPELNLEPLRKIVDISVTTLNDQVTQQEIVKELKEASGQEGLKNAVKEGLLNAADILDPPYKDWENGFRIPVNTEIDKLSLTTDTEYDLVIDVLLKEMQ